MWRRHPTELRADMQRVYGVDMDEVARGSVSLEQASALAACLPHGSLCLAREDEVAGWSREQMLLLDGIIGILHSDALRSLLRLSCFLGKLIHIHSAYLLILQIPQNLIYMHERTLVPSSRVSFWSSLRWLLIY